MNERRFRLRVTYAIEGRLAMLSHLEIARALERMVRRARLPFAVTNGFSPHMRIAFGSALPVGVGGQREIFDIHLVRYISAEKAACMLEQAAPCGIDIVDCRYIENSEAAASVAYPVSIYEAILDEEPESFNIPKTIDVVRKKKPKTIDVSDHLLGDPDIDGCKVRFSLVALPTGSLRPDVFIRACLDFKQDAQARSPRLRSMTRIEQKTLEDVG